MTLHEARARAQAYRAQGVGCTVAKANDGRSYYVLFESGTTEPERRARAVRPRRGARRG